MSVKIIPVEKKRRLLQINYDILIYFFIYRKSRFMSSLVFSSLIIFILNFINYFEAHQIFVEFVFIRPGRLLRK